MELDEIAGPTLAYLHVAEGTEWATDDVGGGKHRIIFVTTVTVLYNL